MDITHLTSNALGTLIQDISIYFTFLFRGIGHALTLDPKLYAVVDEYPDTRLVVLGIVFLAGASMLLGQSVVLFINRVRRGRFLISLALNGLMFIISYIIWGLAIWLVGTLLFPVAPEVGAVVRLVGLSTAPLVFGFFILIPWMGPFIGKVLNIWGFLILVSVIEVAFQVGLVRALVCVGLGWLLMLGLTRFIGKPFIMLRNFLWTKVAGSPLDANTQDLLLDFSKAKDSPVLLPGGKS